MRLSGRAVAKRIGISHVTISQCECGIRLPSMAVLAGWVAALGWEPGELDRLLAPLRAHAQRRAALAAWADANHAGVAVLLDALGRCALTRRVLDGWGRPAGPSAPNGRYVRRDDARASSFRCPVPALGHAQCNRKPCHILPLCGAA